MPPKPTSVQASDVVPRRGASPELRKPKLTVLFWVAVAVPEFVVAESPWVAVLASPPLAEAPVRVPPPPPATMSADVPVREPTLTNDAPPPPPCDAVADPAWPATMNSRCPAVRSRSAVMKAPRPPRWFDAPVDAAPCAPTTVKR